MPWRKVDMAGQSSRPLVSDSIRARFEQSERAWLRVYLGAAPGVGKTYQMLRDGHLLRDQGVDVAIGFIETYGRLDTEEQIKDLYTVPRRRIPYRNVVLEE